MVAAALEELTRRAVLSGFLGGIHFSEVDFDSGRLNYSIRTYSAPLCSIVLYYVTFAYLDYSTMFYCVILCYIRFSRLFVATTTTCKQRLTMLHEGGLYNL
jgi:hypothetical protein